MNTRLASAILLIGTFTLGACGDETPSAVVPTVSPGQSVSPEATETPETPRQRATYALRLNYPRFDSFTDTEIKDLFINTCSRLTSHVPVERIVTMTMAEQDITAKEAGYLIYQSAFSTCAEHIDTLANWAQ